MCYAAAAVSDRGLRWCRLAEGFSTQVTLKHSLFILYLEYATARVVPVGGRVFHTEDKRLSLEIGKDAAAVRHDVVDGRVFHKHLLSLRPALSRCWF